MRILWLKTELLHPVDKGGKIRTYQMLKDLQREHHVTYLTLDDGSARRTRPSWRLNTVMSWSACRTAHARSSRPASTPELALNLVSQPPLLHDEIQVGRNEARNLGADGARGVRRSGLRLPVAERQRAGQSRHASRPLPAQRRGDDLAAALRGAGEPRQEGVPLRPVAQGRRLRARGLPPLRPRRRRLARGRRDDAPRVRRGGRQRRADRRGHRILPAARDGAGGAPRPGLHGLYGLAAERGRDPVFHRRDHAARQAERARCHADRRGPQPLPGVSSS